MSNSLNTISVSYNSRQVDFEFDPIRNHLQGLSEKLVMLEKVAQRIHKERKGLLYYSFFLSLKYLNTFLSVSRTVRGISSTRSGIH